MSVTMTKELITEHAFGKTSNAINSSQCIILGFEFKDLKKHWLKNFQDKIISNASFELFKLLKGAVGKSNQMKIINNFKAKQKKENKMFKIIKAKDV